MVPAWFGSPPRRARSPSTEPGNGSLAEQEETELTESERVGLDWLPEWPSPLRCVSPAVSFSDKFLCLCCLCCLLFKSKSVLRLNGSGLVRFTSEAGALSFNGTWKRQFS